MKKIINGKRYNTENAKLIGEYDNGLSIRDFSWCEMALYKTPRSGQYFMAGKGGPMSRFSRSVGQNEWTGGEDLTPLTREEAFEWAQQFLSNDEIEAEFGDMVEDA